MKKITILGPESTGKSTLCERLAAHFGTQWCPEYAREYLTRHGTSYTFADLLTIAKGQFALERRHIDEAHSQQHPYLFVDTDQYVMRIWCEFVFDDCHLWILDRLAAGSADLYLLCDIDLPWIPDELREYPDPGPRRHLYHMYRDLLVQQHRPWVEISGNYEQRLHTAITAVESAI